MDLVIFTIFCVIIAPLLLIEAIKNSKIEDLVLNKGGVPGVLIFCVFFVTIFLY